MRDASRCPWAKGELYAVYHDREWGVPLHDERALFELLVLEGAQAGLAWITILRKREAYRKAFDGFDPAKVARFTERRIARLLADPGIVRNRLKIESAISNARATLALYEEGQSLNALLWSFVDGKPRQNARRTIKDVPATSPESDAMSKDLRRRGFRFVGSTICYALMQSAGLVNDHLTTCFRYREAQQAPARRPRS